MCLSRASRLALDSGQEETTGGVTKSTILCNFRKLSSGCKRVQSTVGQQKVVKFESDACAALRHESQYLSDPDPSTECKESQF